MMHRLFLDANVLLDHLLDRKPFADAAAEVWSMVERGEAPGLVSAISFNLVNYIVRHEAGERAARKALRGLRDIFEIVSVDPKVVRAAIEAPFADFEDATQHACALNAKATHLLTRKERDFRQALLPVLSPAAYLRALGRSGTGS